MNKEIVKKIFTIVLPCLITLGILIYFCFKDNSLSVLLNIFPKLDKLYLFLSVILMVLYWIFDALSIRELSPNLFSSFFEYFKLTMYGLFYGSITPFSSGSQASQILMLKNNNISYGKSISILSKKLFISQICTVVISSLSILFRSHKFKDSILGFRILTSVGLLIQCSGILLIVFFYINKKKLMNIINLIFRLTEKLKIIKHSKKICVDVENNLSYLMENNFSINNKFTVFIYSFLQIISFYMISFFISKSFGLPGFPIIDIVSAQVFVSLLSIANPLPGSAGTAEGSFVLLHRQFFDEKDILPSMILFRLINYYLNLIVGLVVILLNKKNRNN